MKNPINDLEQTIQSIVKEAHSRVENGKQDYPGAITKKEVLGEARHKLWLAICHASEYDEDNFLSLSDVILAAIYRERELAEYYKWLHDGLKTIVQGWSNYGTFADKRAKIVISENNVLRRQNEQMRENARNADPVYVSAELESSKREIVALRAALHHAHNLVVQSRDSILSNDDIQKLESHISTIDNP